jgi:hypothetical protein
VFRRVYHWTLTQSPPPPQKKTFQSTSLHLILIRAILIFTSYLCLSVFPSGTLTKILYSLCSPMYAEYLCSPSLLDLFILILFGEIMKSMQSSPCSCYFRSRHSPQCPILRYADLYSSFETGHRVLHSYKQQLY